ncbi:MAG: hypothetical protein GX184_03455 [Clostridiaceae bacterium]|nr:hypothetical protein [Clostridiaceae bacterium]
MDQAFRLLVIVAVLYLVFLCVIRLVMGTVYKSKSFLINIIGIITVFGGFILSRFGEYLKLPDYIYYIVPVLLIVLLPPLSLNMKTDQTLKYLIFFVVSVVLIHVLFSLLVGWKDLLPFIKIPSLWGVK